MVAQPHSGDHALAVVGVREDRDYLTLSLCEAVSAAWLQNPLYYYDTERMGYRQCGCEGIAPPTTEHTLRTGFGYWVCTYEDYLTLVLP